VVAANGARPVLEPVLVAGGGGAIPRPLPVGVGTSAQKSGNHFLKSG